MFSLVSLASTFARDEEERSTFEIPLSNEAAASVTAANPTLLFDSLCNNAVIWVNESKASS